MLHTKTLLLIFILFVSTHSHAAITFTDGKWETTFDCVDQTITTTVNCDQMGIYLQGASSDGSHSVISSAHNNPGGIGGKGYGAIEGFGDKGAGAGVNDNSEGFNVAFSTPQKELWIRYYRKWPTNWGSTNYQWSKLLYVQTTSNLMQALLEPDPTGFRIYVQRTGGYVGVQSTYKMTTDMMGGAYGDAEWHCIEMHVKMDTDTTDGVGQIWVDDVLIAESSNINYSNGVAVTQAGFTNFTCSLNQAYIINVDDSHARISMDDLVVYNTTPLGRDADNNPYIGPIGAGTPTYDSPTITGPYDFNTTASSVEINGSYATDPDLPDQSVVVTWTLWENSGFAVASLGVFSCTVPNLALGANSIVFEITGSNSGTDNDTTVITRTAPKASWIRGAAVVKNATIH